MRLVWIHVGGLQLGDARESTEVPSLRAQGRRTNPWADLVLAMLSVNNFPLTKTFGLYDALEANGLFDLRNLACWDLGEIARRLGAAGYDRGDVMTAIFVERLFSLGTLANELDTHTRTISNGTRQEVTALLIRVKGVGPMVLDNFFLLRG